MGKYNAEKDAFTKRWEKLEDTEPTRTSVTINYFPETHLGQAHKGLSTLAKKKKIDVDKLRPGEYVIFMNRRRNALKMFTCMNGIFHHKLPYESLRYDLRFIKLIPRFFNGKELNYDGALKEIIMKDLGVAQ